MMRLFIWILTVTIIAGLSYGFWVTKQSQYWQGEVAPKYMDLLGFTYGTPYVKAGLDKIEVFTLHPKPGGLFERQGVRDGDIVLELQINDLFKALDSNRGGQIKIRVVSGGNGLPIKERPVRNIIISVPE